MSRVGKGLAGLVLAFCAFAGEAGPAHAEFYLAGYLGASMTEYHDVVLQDDVAFGPGGVRLRLKEVKLEASFSRGGKLGYWFGILPHLGLEVDAYHYNPVIVAQSRLSMGMLRGRAVPAETKVVIGGVAGVDRATVRVEGIGFLVMGRLRLARSPAYPRGRLQPYGGAGPAIFLQEFQFKPVSNRSVDHAQVGVQALGGLRYFLHRNVALFAEYKFSHARAPIRYDAFGTGDRTTRLDTAISSHHLSGGLALHLELF